ncbi:MAG TPA: DUF3137 domain-containing protein, partial [Terricaulis sp.]|nr:DUF3137 domain-containing protein [Terricaulis sp.]
AGFQRVYHERIAPHLLANEGARLQAVQQCKTRVTWGALAAIAAAALAYAMFRDVQAAVAVGVLGGGAIWAYAYGPLAEIGARLKDQYCRAMASAMGAHFQIKGFNPAAFARMCLLKIAPEHKHAYFEDCFAGFYKGASFDLYEAHLSKPKMHMDGRIRETTVFQGQLIRLHFPRGFSGVTIVRREAGFLNMFGGGVIEGRQLQRVGLTPSAFERAFEVWSTDQVEARYLLHPMMLERLIALEAAFKGEKLRCAFEGGSILIAIEGGNLFEPGDLFQSFHDPVRARRIIEEFASMFRVMDYVLTAQSLRPVA